MAQDALTNAILIIASIIATIALVNAVYPSLFTATDSIGSVSGTASDRVKTDVKITMSSQPNASALFVWAKNVGSTNVPASKIAYTDVYFGDPGSVSRAETDEGAPFHWSHVLDDLDEDGNWGPGETLQILVSDTDGSYLTEGTHNLEMVLYNSVSVKDTITI
jgi:flagellar protein FlaG